MRSATTCKVCRRLGVSVCGREKCALKRKPYPPGIHGKAYRRGSSEYGLQLREKQKVKFTYGLRERQFKNYVTKAINQKAMRAGEAILAYLESRLDNIVYRLGFAPNRASARQLVSHGHMLVNQRRVSIPSYKVKMGDEIAIRKESAGKGIFSNLDLSIKKYIPPVWLEIDKEKKIGRMVAHPASESQEKGYNINAIVEYYSR